MASIFSVRITPPSRAGSSVQPTMLTVKSSGPRETGAGVTVGVNVAVGVSVGVVVIVTPGVTVVMLSDVGGTMVGKMVPGANGGSVAAGVASVVAGVVSDEVVEPANEQANRAIESNTILANKRSFIVMFPSNEFSLRCCAGAVVI